MATAYTSGDVMNAAAALMNDPARTLYSYTVQLPFLKMAMQELEQAMDLFENPYNRMVDRTITLAANTHAPTLPADFFLPISLQEREGSETLMTDWKPMTEVPNVLELGLDPGVDLLYWDFRNGVINTPAATTAKDINLYYWRMILVTITNESYTENYTGANNFLAYRTAALLATFINKDDYRASNLNANAEAALDLLISIYTKNNQGVRVRRKPFRRY